jgi:hypothetical protein
VPVVGKTAAELARRAEYFERTLGHFIQSALLRGLTIDYHPKVHNLLSHAYFGLSEAYKGEFLYPDKGTDPTKQAAITCATIATIRPLHAPQPDITNEEYIYMNQMLAIRCGCAIVEHPFHTRAWADRWRFYKMLERLDLPCLRPMIDEAVANNGDLKTQFVFKLSTDEEFKLKSLVNLFVTLKDLKIYRADPTINPDPDIGPGVPAK